MRYELDTNTFEIRYNSNRVEYFISDFELNDRHFEKHFCYHFSQLSSYLNSRPIFLQETAPKTLKHNGLARRVCWGWCETSYLMGRICQFRKARCKYM